MIKQYTLNDIPCCFTCINNYPLLVNYILSTHISLLEEYPVVLLCHYDTV